MLQVPVGHLEAGEAVLRPTAAPKHLHHDSDLVTVWSFFLYSLLVKDVLAEQGFLAPLSSNGIKRVDVFLNIIFKSVVIRLKRLGLFPASWGWQITVKARRDSLVANQIGHHGRRYDQGVLSRMSLGRNHVDSTEHV